MGFRPDRIPAAGAASGSSREGERWSDGPRVHAAFESGNLGAWEWRSPSHLYFTARADASPKPLWFYFRLEDVRVPSVVCELTNADECFGPRKAWIFARPVYSVDGRNWRRVERASYEARGEGPGSFQFSVPIHGPVTYVAYCIPYTTADLNGLLGEVSRSPGLSQQVCGRSAEGRPIPHLVFGQPTAGAPAIWVLARQHAGETPASWVADGLIRYLAGSGGPAGGAIHVTPMVDPDGVFAGRYGKDERPIDFNRDWCARPARPETAALLAAMRRVQATHPLALVLDIHASHHGDTECYLFGEDQDDHPAARVLQTRCAELLAHYGPPGIGVRGSDLRISAAPPRSARGHLAREFGCPALTLEVSYHLTQSGRYPGVREYSELGAAAGRVLVDLLSRG